MLGNAVSNTPNGKDDIRWHSSDVYLRMSLVQNSSSYVLARVGKTSETVAN